MDPSPQGRTPRHRRHARGRRVPPDLAHLTNGAVRAEFETKVLGYLRCARASGSIHY